MVETFQADKEGCYSPIQRDDNKDGIQDAYDEIGVDVAEMNETIELLLDEKTYNKINKYGRVVEKKVENNDIKYVYHLKMGDDIEKYYDLNGNKIININNILYSRNVMEMSGDTYSLYIYDNNGNLYAKCAYDGKNQIYNEYNYGKKGLETIKHNGFEYKYGYTNGEVTELDINDKKIYDRKLLSTNNMSITLANGYSYNLLTDKIGKTYIYEYDGGGNIDNVKSFNYSYGIPTSELNECERIENYNYDSKFKDQLVSVVGKNITYDDVGNPIRYMDKYNMKWTFGNKLSEIDNKSGQKIAEYLYNGWGEVINQSGDKEIAKLNPLRYRGYYYDEESGFYYLNNRYYDSSIKRMINMDRYTDTGFGMFSHNMYAYCENTPVNASNYSGNVPAWVKKHSKSPSGKNYFWKSITNNSGVNCYAYAVDLSNRKNPGELCGYNFHYNFTETYIRDLIIKDLNKRKYECRKVSPSDARTVTSDWKLIALRIGKSKTQGLGAENYQDYHVMRRRYKDGAFWAHKPGCVSSVLIYNGDPITAKTWNGDEYDGGWGDTTYRYTSSICLIAYR